MFCPQCGAAALQGQRFCTECGVALGSGATAAAGTAAAAEDEVTLPPTAAMPAAPPPPAPVAAPVPEPMPAPAPAPMSEAAMPTEAITVVEQTAHMPSMGYEDAVWPVDTNEQPMVAQPFRITPLLAVSALAGILAVAAAVTTLVSYTVTGVLEGSTSFVMNDVGTSHLVGAIIGAVVLIAGAALGATGRRVGTGLAGGAGLALAGMLANACGMGVAVLDQAQINLLAPGTTVTVTYELGFFLAIAAAALGGVAFVLSLREMGPDGMAPVPVAIGVLGALGTLAVVIGTLIPGDFASFADNFGTDFIPPATSWMRILVLALIAVGGLLGFLVNRRWGLGMALGSISVGVWMWATAITESGDIPFGIAGGNVGALDTKPHVVTTVGVIVMVVAGVVGLVAAMQQRNSG